MRLILITSGFNFRLYFYNLPSRLLPTSYITSQHGSKLFCPCEKSSAYLWQKRKLVSLFIMKHDGIQTKVSIPFININIVNQKMDFSLGNLTLVSFGCVVFGGSFQMVCWLGIAMWMKLVCVWGLDFLPKEECMPNGFYFVWWDLWDGLSPCEFLWVFDFQANELHGTIHLTRCKHSRVSLHSMRLCTLSAPMRVVGIATKSTRANCENSFMNGLKISIIPLGFSFKVHTIFKLPHIHIFLIVRLHSWNT
jgi:hypothetical protein